MSAPGQVPAYLIMSAATALVLLPEPLLAIEAGPRVAEQPVLYSTNAICRQYNCVNPIFPGVMELPQLEATVYQCQSLSVAKRYMQFCRNAVKYDIAVPNPHSATTLEAVVTEQDNAASTMYFYHLAGLNIDAWDHNAPDTSNEKCIRSIWLMVCNTYFPKAQAGCKSGEPTGYQRPCRNVCESYRKACEVECCDESVRCVFEHKIMLDESNYTTESGYAGVDGPSALCTGGARRSAGSPSAVLLAVLAGLLGSPLAGRTAGLGWGAGLLRAPRGALLRSLRRAGLWLAAAVLLMTAVSLQGCAIDDVVAHRTPMWRTIPTYLNAFQHVPQGQDAYMGVRTSCEIEGHPKPCNGNGVCKQWNPHSARMFPKPISFCQCDRSFADPECRTRRKSQMIAYFLAVFGGCLGLDHFYMLKYSTGFLKLATLGGFGIWWIIDIVRVGSAPIYAANFRLAYDLPHWLYVSFTVGLFFLLGYFIYTFVAEKVLRHTETKKQLLMEEDDFHRIRSAAAKAEPTDSVGMPTFSSHGAGPCMSYGATPLVKQSGFRNPYSPYWIVRNALGQAGTSTSKYEADGPLNFPQHGSDGAAPPGPPPPPPSPPGAAVGLWAASL